MRETADVFFKRKPIPVTTEDLTELEQVGWRHIGLAESRKLASMLRDGLTVAADPTCTCCPPGRYHLIEG
jgi:hypothetical protein